MFERVLNIPLKRSTVRNILENVYTFFRSYPLCSSGVGQSFENGVIIELYSELWHSKSKLETVFCINEAILTAWLSSKFRLIIKSLFLCQWEQIWSGESPFNQGIIIRPGTTKNILFFSKRESCFLDNFFNLDNTYLHVATSVSKGFYIIRSPGWKFQICSKKHRQVTRRV